MNWKIRIPSLPRKLYCFIFIGFLIRILLSLYSSEPDVSTFASSSVSMGFGNGPYSFITIYPPGWIFLLNGIGRVSSLFLSSNSVLTTNPILSELFLKINFASAWIAAPGYVVVEKSVLWVFDFLSGMIIFVVLNRKFQDTIKATYGFALWFLNPFVIVESSIHGAFDTLPVFFTLLAFFFIENDRPLFSGLSIGIGFMLKLFPIYFAIFAVPILLIKHKGKSIRFIKTFATFLVGGAVSIAIILLPLVLTNGLSNYLSLILTGPSVAVNFSGFNMWSLVNIDQLSPIKYVLEMQFAIVERVSTAVILAIIVFICYLIWKSGEQEIFSGRSLHAITAGGIFITFLEAQTQPQYLLWFFPFLALLVVESSKYRWIYIAISVCATIVYLFGIAGPLFFFEPLFIFAGVPSLQFMLGNILYWYGLSKYIGTPFTVIVFFLELYLILIFFRKRRHGINRKVTTVAT